MDGTGHPGLRARLRGGETVVGAWMSTDCAITAELLGRGPYGYVCVDLQHGAAEAADLARLVNAISLGGRAAPIARVVRNDAGQIGRALDAGAHGVIVPMVDDADAARAAVHAARYAPAGGRSWGPAVVGMRADDARAWADEHVVVAVMVETVTALANLDEIAAVPGIDAIYVGPADLSLSHGLAPRDNDGEPVFDDALAAVVAACGRHGVVPGVHAPGTTAATRRSQGFRMVTGVSDLGALRAGLASQWTAATGDADPT